MTNNYLCYHLHDDEALSLIPAPNIKITLTWPFKAA